MGTNSSHFLRGPRTKLGWWSVGLGALFTILFLLIINELIRFSGFLTMTLGVIAGFITLAALIWKRERSWLVWLMLLPGLFAILFALGEIFFPH
jgi:hypothetical protein